MVSEEWRPYAETLDSASLADAARKLGYPPRYMDAGIKPVWSGAKTMGPAHTVRVIPGQSACTEAIEAARPGDVIVVDARGRTDAIVWGELFSGLAARAGLAGAVVDGAVRDLVGVEAVGFPLFARAVLSGTAPWHGRGRSQVPVTVGHVRVRPRDIVLADEVGVVVVDPDHWQEVARAAGEIQHREGERMEGYLAEVRARNHN